MFGQIHLCDVHAQTARDFGGWMLLDDVQVKQLILPGVGAAFHLFESSVNQILLPLLIPERIQFRASRIGNSIRRRSRGRSFVAVRAWRTSRLTFSQLVRNAPSSDMKQPAFEGTERAIG